jgi:hypothetical protein
VCIQSFSIFQEPNLRLLNLQLQRQSWLERAKAGENNVNSNNATICSVVNFYSAGGFFNSRSGVPTIGPSSQSYDPFFAISTNFRYKNFDFLMYVRTNEMITSKYITLF